MIEVKSLQTAGFVEYAALESLWFLSALLYISQNQKNNLANRYGGILRFLLQFVTYT